MQTITDFIVYANNKLHFISHRNNDEHILPGASDYLRQKGIADTKTTKEVTAWIGDHITVVDFYGIPLFKGMVVAKMVREWDFSKPIGKGNRLASIKKSASWDAQYAKYNSLVKLKHTY